MKTLRASYAAANGYYLLALFSIVAPGVWQTQQQEMGRVASGKENGIARVPSATWQPPRRLPGQAFKALSPENIVHEWTLDLHIVFANGWHDRQRLVQLLASHAAANGCETSTE